MRISVILLLLIPTSTLFGASPSGKIALTAQSLKAFVENRNERVRAISQEHQGASRRKGFLVRSFLPTVEVYGAQEQFRKGPLSSRSQPTFGAEARMNLFNGGRDQLEEKRRSLVTERKEFEKEQLVSLELGKAREAYWHVLYLRDFITLLKEARRNNADNLKSAERRIRSGVATEIDRVEFQMQDIDLKRDLQRAELEQKNQIRNLVVVLGLEQGTELEFNEPMIHEHDWRNALKHGESDHEFLVKPKKLLAQELDTIAASERRAWLPKADLFAGYNQFNQREEEDFPNASDRQENVVGVRLTLDLFENGTGPREAAALSSEADAARSEARYVQREVEAYIHGQIAELELLHNLVHEAEENIKRAERYYRLTHSEYKRGVKNSPDMLGATEKLISMRQKRLEIVRDFQIAKSHVLSKIGR